MWLVYAVGASILWGLDYALTEKILKKISFPTLLSIELFFGFISMLAISLVLGSYKTDFHTITNSKTLLYLVIGITLSFAFANTFIVLSIQGKNASIAGLIEIAYPLFIVLFSWLLFKENNLNLATWIGGGLVFVGVSVIYLFNK